MLYLEDYIELIEHLPDELRDRLTEMREMDLNVQNTIDSINVHAENFFARSRRLKSDERDKEYERIYGEYRKVHEEALEKAALADKMHGLFAKHLRKLDQELVKFKMELEADNSGITEVLEKRSLELDGANGTVGGSSHKPLYLRNLAFANRKHDTRKNGSNKKPLGRLVTGTTFQGFRSGLGVGNLKMSIAKPDPRVIVPGQAGKNGTLLKQQQQIYLDDGEDGSNPIAAAASQAIVATQQLQLGRRSSSLKASYEAAKNSDLKSLTKDFAATKKRNTNPNLMTSSQNLGGINTLSGGNQSPNSFFGKSTDASKASFDDVSFSPTITNLIQNAKFNPNPARDEVFIPSGAGSNVGISLLNLPSNDQSAYGQNTPFNGRDDDDPYANTIHFAAPQPPHKRVAPWNGATTGLPNPNRRRNARSDRDNLGREREDVGVVGDEDDPDEPRYCVCHQVSYGEMVACDNPGCPYEWFHYPCVGINQPPKGKWYCPRCVAAIPNLINPSGQR